MGINIKYQSSIISQQAPQISRDKKPTTFIIITIMILRIIFTIIIIIINQGTGLGDCTDEESTRYIEQVKLVITSISYYVY
jgi:hypothetical protein